MHQPPLKKPNRYTHTITRLNASTDLRGLGRRDQAKQTNIHASLIYLPWFFHTDFNPSRLGHTSPPIISILALFTDVLPHHHTITDSFTNPFSLQDHHLYIALTLNPWTCTNCKSAFMHKRRIPGLFKSNALVHLYLVGSAN